MRGKNRYSLIIEQIFFAHYKQGAREVAFEREDIVRTARRLRIKLPETSVM